MQENSCDELLKEAFDLFCKLSDNQIMEILKSIQATTKGDYDD